MNWMPDPVDAAPDYRKSKSSDVIGSLISLFESKETFVREMQNMLAERLLQKRADFEQEMSVLELLKLRFGDNALQACEVMLRDIFDSRRVDAVVRNDQGMVTSTAQDNDTADLHAKILSHFFWPEIQGQQFKVPEEITQLQQRYSEGFESLKQSRKLTWLNGLGQVTVELDLEDRVFVEEVTTWQATVIYAFNSPSNDSITRTTAELASQLDMSPVLVRSACLFWVSRRILTEVQRDTFRVLETLPTKNVAGDDNAAPTGLSRNLSSAGETSNAETAAANAAAAAAAAARESAEAAAMEKMNLYWQFIVGMLTNQGAMPLQQIVMMLKIAVPGGFPFSNEELREFLAGMVSRGKLEIVSGGNYKLVR
jgi:anaphase-promoting complex subunit 2